MIKKESWEIEANIYATRDKHAVKGVALGRRDPFAEIRNRRKDTQAFSNTGLEVGELAYFVLESRRRDCVVGNVSVDFAEDTIVHERVGDDMEKDCADGCSCCV